MSSSSLSDLQMDHHRHQVHTNSGSNAVLFVIHMICCSSAQLRLHTLHWASVSWRPWHSAFIFPQISRCLTDQIKRATAKYSLFGLGCLWELIRCKLICMRGQDTLQKAQSHCRAAALVNTGLSSPSSLLSYSLSSLKHTLAAPGTKE